MPSPNRSAAASFDVELHREEIDNTKLDSKMTFLALASSTAATLPPSVRTAHSVLKLPLSTQFIEAPTCNISKTSGMGKTIWERTNIVCRRFQANITAIPAIPRPTPADEINDYLNTLLYGDT
ncbi:unnamed protein product [Onchocerca ochengi]|uniref:Uncharacterized protein n=1 Tax=Onchocerca ochengi TaxID=42157 RepID=A0A182ED36_ONCOC|nr:unnamed protein product [Onchocerca ochengi]